MSSNSALTSPKESRNLVTREEGDLKLLDRSPQSVGDVRRRAISNASAQKYYQVRVMNSHLSPVRGAEVVPALRHSREMVNSRTRGAVFG